ncbi:MAG: 7-carboxy-7-deazaguanine synthase [Bacteroidia bacterium]|jgi:7-carboxy-7-deazaguanine synthase
MPNAALPVMEEFYTIQGEGFHTGRAAYFIRLAGCDVGCVWCDVKESWHTEGYPTKTPEELALRASAQPSEIVVITGGEPAMYDLTALCFELHKVGKKVHIETSGAHPIRGSFDWICFSPKKFKAPIDEAAGMAHELKVIIFNKSDFTWALSFENLVPSHCIKYLQPEWSRHEEVQPSMVDFVQSNPDWRIGLQTHKFLGVE